jgi:hypothetical protein
MSKHKKGSPAPTAKHIAEPKVKSGMKISAWAKHLIAILGFVVITCFYFYPQLEGKKVMQHDILQWEGMAQEAIQHEKETGEITLWTNSMFGGMPTYQINNYQPNNLLQYVQKLAELFFEAPIGLFIAASLWMYLLLIILGVPIGVAWIGAFSFSFTTYNVILYEAGHYLKLQSIGTFPLILSGLYLLIRRKYLMGFVLYSLGLGMSIYANHPQMTYYLAIVLGLYFLGESIRQIREREIKEWGLGVLLLIGGSILALGSGASKLYTSYEYSRDTMRGQPILTPGANPGSSSETEGLAWEYAMQWSQGPLEIMTMLVPGIVGGSSAEKSGSKSALRTSLRSQGVNLPSDFKVPLYWGSLPFTSGPVYFGVLILFFFLLGMLLEQSKTKWWILAGIIFTLLYSLGQNFEILNRFIFDYFPMMNKFRAPNSITALTPLLMIFLGAIVLKHIFDGTHSKERTLKAIWYSAGSLGGLALLFGLLGPYLFDFTGEGNQRMVEVGFPMDAVKEDRQSLLRMDSFRSVLFIGLAAFCLWMYLKNKLSATMAVAIMVILGIVDLWGINKRYLSKEDFKSKKEYEAFYTPRAVDELILKDVDPHYRVLDLSTNTFNSTFASYFHKSLGGYHAAKLQRYQDLIDRHISKNNMKVLNMLNTKYFIMPAQREGEKEDVQINMEALGNAWFVQNVMKVNTADEEIDYLGNEAFDPATTAVVHQEYEGYIGQSEYSSTGEIKLTEYRPNQLKYQTSSEEAQLAVFSEVWYGPDKGWNAYIDDKPVEHIRVNYALRALVVPAGQHEIEFSFEPRSHAIGEKVSLAGSLVIVLLGVFMLMISIGIMKKKHSPFTEDN